MAWKAESRSPCRCSGVFGTHGVHRDAGQGTALAGAEDVQQDAAVLVLPSDPTGATDPRVLLHGGCLCAVGRWLLVSVVEGAAAGLGPGEQMASMRLRETQGA